MSTFESQCCAEYDALSRRQFMRATSGATAMFVAAAAAAPAWLPRVAIARDFRSSMRDVIISIYLRGASDGLTMVVPYQESAYYTARPTLNVPPPSSTSPDKAIDLNGFFGFSPAMGALKPAYDAGRLLVVHATGSKDPTRSHFDGQRYMEVGLPGSGLLASGWLGRHLATVAPADPGALLRGVGIATGLQMTLVSGPQTLPIPNLDTFGLSGASATAALRADALGDMYAAGATEPLKASALNTLATIDLLNTINFSGYVPANGATYPVNDLGTALKSVAALIKADIGVEAVAIDVGGWDTHANQGITGTGSMATLMTRLSQSLGAFDRDLSSPSAPGYLAVVMSEFGRRLTQNGTSGTDHGHGNCMLISANKCITGGRVLANWPGLSPANLFEGKDLDVTIDYRDILAEIVDKRLGNASSLEAVFPDFVPTYRGVVNC